MARQRVFITGMGGELGSRVAKLLEPRTDIEAIVGMDMDPPRSSLDRAEFHRIDLDDRRTAVALIRDLEPTSIIHLGVYEPNARRYPSQARRGTAAVTIAALGAAAECPSLERIVSRSGIEVYGRARGAPTRPDETVLPAPTTPFGRSLLHTEELATSAGEAADVPVTTLRFAPVVGPHFPSPLGRYLRLPVVPVSVLSDLPFSLTHQEDAALAMAAALGAGHHGPVNVVGPGAVTAVQAVRMGGRIPAPTLPPVWIPARVGAELLGAPLPPHVIELLRRGRCADGSRAADAIGHQPAKTTQDVVKELYEWAPVTYLAVSGTQSGSRAPDLADPGEL